MPYIYVLALTFSISIYNMFKPNFVQQQLQKNCFDDCIIGGLVRRKASISCQNFGLREHSGCFPGENRIDLRRKKWGRKLGIHMKKFIY